MEYRYSQAACHHGCETGVSVTENQERIGLNLAQDRLNLGEHVPQRSTERAGIDTEPTVRWAEPELFEEDVRELRVPVLTGMNDSVFRAGIEAQDDPR